MSITAQQMPYVVYSAWQTFMYVNTKSRVLEFPLECLNFPLVFEIYECNVRIEFSV